MEAARKARRAPDEATGPSGADRRAGLEAVTGGGFLKSRPVAGPGQSSGGDQFDTDEVAADDLDRDAHPCDAGRAPPKTIDSAPFRRGSLLGAGDTCSVPTLRSRFARSNTSLDIGTEHELCSCLVLVVCRSWIMVRAVVEEAATLASLALFLGMIAIWAQVIATL